MSDILGIGVSGLNAYQSLLSTVSHNISNSSTEGYSRQVTELRTRSPRLIDGGLIGSGVAVTGTTRVVDDLLTEVHRGNVASESQLDFELTKARQVNDLLGDENTGFSEALNNFYNALNTLSENPRDTGARQVFLSESNSLVKRINSLDNRIEEQLLDVNAQTLISVNQVNSISNSLVQLNKNIAVAANLGEFSSPNDLLDQRDRLLEDLSELVQISTIEQEDGSVDVFVGNGVTLVIGENRTVLDTAVNPDDATILDVRATSSITNQIITRDVVGGRLGGLRNVREEILDPTRAQLGRIILTLGSTFNAQHQKGVDLNGNLGGLFFNDVNDLFLQFDRSLPDGSNLGTGILTVSIDEIQRPTEGPYTVNGVASALSGVGTLSQINSGELTINGFTVGTAVADGVSPAGDAAASAIASATAINAALGNIVTASAQINTLNLGSFTTGALAAGDFVINGSDVISTGADIDTLLIDINALSPTTGVTAEKDTNNNVILYAADGRNIQLGRDGGAVGQFQMFDLTLATTLVQRAGVTLTSNSQPIVIAGSTPSQAGFTAGTTPATTTSMTSSDYQLSFDGTTYSLLRESDNVIVASSNTTTLQADGITVNVNSGTVQSGDIFYIRPTRSASKKFAMQLNDLDNMAMGSAIKVGTGFNGVSNAGSGEIRLEAVLDTDGVPSGGSNTQYGNAFDTVGQLNPPIRIVFSNDENGVTNRYRVFDISGGVPGEQIGPEQVFNPNQDNAVFPLTSVIDRTAPGPNTQYTYDPGYRITLSGAPAEGDIFTIDYNSDGVDDNGNAQELIALKEEKLIGDGSSSYQGAYAELASFVGSVTNTRESDFLAAESLRRSSLERIQSISGVNLDEEAAKLIRFQQAYRAAAQIITIGSSIFDSLIDAVRR